MTNISNLNGGPPRGWHDRVGSEITFASPDGDEFVAKWAGESPRSIEKNVGIFSYPKFKGETTQDLGIKSTRYSIKFYFDGKDNDLTSKKFHKSLEQNGQWGVNHPVYGTLSLQPLTIEINDDPVKSGNIAEINSQWIEPAIDEVIFSPPQSAKLIKSTVNKLDVSSAQQFADRLKTGTELLRSKIENTVAKIQTLVNTALEPLFTANDALDNAVTAINNGITDTLAAAILNPLELIGQVQQLIELPVLGATDVISRLRTYAGLYADMLTLVPGNTTEESFNDAILVEGSMSAIISSLALIASEGPKTSGLQTREDAINSAESIMSVFESMTDNLDVVQSLFLSNDIDNQYFSQSQAYNDALTLVSIAVKYLYTSAFDLKIKKTIKLGRPTTPFEIAVSEYGGIGDNDELVDLVIESNDLHGNEILLLGQGREVVVYV